MVGCEALVKATIENPFQVYQDPKHIDGRIIYKSVKFPRWVQPQVLRVIIRYAKLRFKKEKIGYIRTAHASFHSGRKGEILIWSAS
jgi:hypothetical protein